jgi:Ca2+-binding EF-hand superfamily protein
MSEYSNEELDKLKKTFDTFDKDDNGTIDWDEFCLLIETLVGKISLEEKSIAFHLVDTNYTGLISFEEFIA